MIPEIPGDRAIAPQPQADNYPPHRLRWDSGRLNPALADLGL